MFTIELAAKEGVHRAVGEEREKKHQGGKDLNKVKDVAWPPLPPYNTRESPKIRTYPAYQHATYT